MMATSHGPEPAVLAHVLADLTRRHIVYWHQQLATRRTPLGPLLRCGDVGSADVLVVLAPYGYVLALTGTGRNGTLSRVQRALIDTISASGGVALIVHTQPWFALVDQATTGPVTQHASHAADAAPGAPED